jgi:molybdate transport system substrate-binding protein
MKHTIRGLAAGVAVVLSVLPPRHAAGREIRAFMTIAVQGAVGELIPGFEQASGDRVIPTWATAALLNERVKKGEPADVLISTRSGIEALLKSGTIVAGSETDLARVGVAVAVRRGAAKPDISTADAFKRTLLAARAIGYSDPAAGGVSGVHFAAVAERLGIAGEVKAKSKFPPASGLSATLLVSGEADLAVQQVSELMAVPGAEIVGPLPKELQLVTTFTAGVPAKAAQAEAARAFVRYLQSAAAGKVLQGKGLEPAGTR